MDLATRIGANPAKLAGTRTNISFLGKGPSKNPLFQNRLAGLENASAENLGDPKNLFAAIDDAVGWAKDGKLNGIQTEILGHNLSGIEKILHPPVLPSASVTPIASGIEGLKRFPRETHKFMGRPLKDKDFSEIDRMIMEGKIPDARGRTWNLKAPETGTERYNKLTGLDKSRPFQGWKPSVVPKANIPASKINHQIIADKYGIDVELIEGKDWVEVLEIIRKLGYAEGGLAEVLQVRSGYSKGRIAKNVLSILNRNKKNADYMFKASDNVSPGYAKGDLKYNAELLADQLAEDAGVVYDDLGALERTEFYGTAYDYLAKEMMQYRQMTKMLTDVEQKMQLSDFSVKGRKPSASGGLARILEV